MNVIEIKHLHSWSDTKKEFLTSAAAHVLCHDAAEIPEARLTAVTLLPSDTRLTGALPGGWIARPLVGAVDITLTGSWGEKSNKEFHFSTANLHFCCL